VKKLIVLLFTLLLFLSSCIKIIEEEDSDEYRVLSSQYEAYISRDILDDQQFQTFLNTATLNTVQSNIMIKVQVYDDLNNLVETRYGSGVVVSKGVFYYVLTTNSLTYTDEYHNVSYQTTDYQGRVTKAYIDHISLDYGLTVLRYQRVIANRLPVIEFAPSVSMQGEPLLLFGFKGKTMNSMTMGLMIEEDVDNETLNNYFYTSISTDEYANGSAIINTNNQLVGIQMGVVDGMSYAISITEIIEFLHVYND